MVTTIIRGGLGNQLYQIAQVVAHSIRYNIPYCIPRKVDTPHKDNPVMYNFLGINYADPALELPLYKEKGFTYSPIGMVDDVCFDGYWQSYKYWNDYKDKILPLFGFRWVMDEGWCAIHVRRGDYMKLPDKHPFVGERYLQNAMLLMNETTGITKFAVFTNDVEWCKFFFDGINQFTIHIFDSGNPLKDMEMGSHCEHQILSNGTFALWMHHLNQNPKKICVAPQRWFGPALDHDTRDLYPKTAIII